MPFSSDEPLLSRQTLGDLLARTAARLPHKTALVYRDERLSYAQLDALANRTAHALAERGIDKGRRVALLSHNNRMFVVLHFALARLGAILVPINYMLNAADVAYILEHSGALGLIAEDRLVPVAEQALAQITQPVTLRGVIEDGGPTAPPGWEPAEAWTRHPRAELPPVAIADDDPLEILYTSGTESRPKGATLSSRNLIAQYESCIVDGEIHRDDVQAHPMPLFHCAQLHALLTPGLQVGSTNVLLPDAEPGRLLATLEREKITSLFCPPTVWISLLRHPDFDHRDLSALAKGYYGASIMPVEIIKELSRRLPCLRLFNFYGQTEMCPMATLLRPEDQLRKLGSAGQAALNVETRVVDPDDQPVPPGEIGEIVHRGPHVMLGYWNDPEKTAEVFRNGWFHSGDLGVMDAEGYLTVVDRKKDMIKTGGENVASREVEEVIYQHPAIAEVAVIGLPHPYWIEQVTAAVVLREGATLDEAALLAFCRERLSSYKVPKRIHVLDALPKNASGKLLKRALRSSLAALGDGASED
ncbi:fatty acyl-CoA synthetase [Aerosticca soli]|uniref:Long-chain-fatty-acid--CoA ligase n=1 Tax=Aerosticca soli TaxID=2010829 RepID=A0A2Z6E8S0_9GAMM|nr:fatty acyl-CoA synthetase [Aerosticca soli]BBD81174.1 long-chain-fatty-acid--CoA ligase [Aerosticca soli]